MKIYESLDYVDVNIIDVFMILYGLLCMVICTY